jgi:type II secretory pathway pseudopilin PulG
MKIKLRIKNYGLRMPPNRAASRAEADSSFEIRHSKFAPAFTLVEIAISLAIIGIALVAIIGVLPWGMNAQRDNRERTVINEDATILMEDIRNGARGADDLTNYVYAIAITNAASGGAGYLNPEVSPQMNFPQSVAQNIFPTVNNNWPSTLASGTNIVGLLSTPEYAYGSTNHIYACVRSISGPAVEKPPQDNDIVVGDSFRYEIICENVPVATPDPNSTYGANLTANLHELRLTFLWPILPSGQLPSRPARQTYRALIAGQVATNAVNGLMLYFFQPQSFTNAP